jgi:hypothetical protein
MSRVVSYKLTDVSEMRTASIIRELILMMEAVSTSETSVNFYETTLRNIPEGGQLPYSQLIIQVTHLWHFSKEMT